MSRLHAIASAACSFIGGPAVFRIVVVMVVVAVGAGFTCLLWTDWRDRRKAPPPPSVHDGPPLWDRTRLTAEEYSALAQIEAEEKAAEQERRDRAMGSGNGSE